MPSPTTQKFIHHAKVVEEFRGFLRSFKNDENFLIFNHQDKTTWKEQARCKALEKLQHEAEFKDHLVVVTFAKNTDFYHQRNSYGKLSRSKDFIGQFKDHLMSDSSGFSFPSKIRKALFPRFLNKLMLAVSRVFFQEKHTLSRQERMNFIELVYFFLELKIIDVIKPDLFSFVCKDGVDVSSMSSSKFFLLMKMINDKLPLSSEGLNLLRLMLFEPALMVRERVPRLSRMDRLIHLIRFVEEQLSEPFKHQALLALEDEMLELYDLAVFKAKIE